MNPVFRIIAARFTQVCLPAAAVWALWQRFAGLPPRPRFTDAALLGAGFSAYLATVFVGPFKLGYPRLMTRLPPGLAGGSIALTFDDGPCPETTPLLLDALRGAGAKATFFVLLDRVVRHPDLLMRIAREGHTIGLHGICHEQMATWSVRQAEHALRLMLKEIAAQTESGSGDGGVMPAVRHFRPPYGFKSRALQTAADRLGLILVTWSNNPKDYEQIEPGQIVSRVIKRIRPGDIILLHDARPETAHALPLLLRRLEGRGMRSVRL